MRKLFVGLKILFFLFLFNAQPLRAETEYPAMPNPPQVVVDNMGLLSTQEKNILSEYIIQNHKATSNEILVYITDDIKNMEPADFCVGLGRAWGIGSKQYNNGLILLILKSPARRTIWISTGYGLEGALPDITCKQIVDDIIKPYFKQEQYFEGIQKGLEAIVAATKGEYKNTNPNKNQGSKSKKEFIAFLIFLGIFIFIFILRKKNGGGGNGGGRSGAGNFITGMLIGSALNSMAGGGHRSGGGSSWGGFGGGSFGGGGAGSNW